MKQIMTKIRRPSTLSLSLRILFMVFFNAPLVALATVTNMDTLITFLKQFFNYVYYILFATAIILFFWGLARFILSASDERARASGRALMFWGLIALFVMVCLWAIVGFIVTTVGVSGGTPCFVDKNGTVVGGANCASL